ncbi:MAG: hypothetical protein BWZ07_02136 [Alphaproteobacteria bacterium ADurb.BinA280]|nr:MAG: hypothetical protein BWZ07_02136 [Alphaproteobacteria bacterium ADurb.BinA280]
MTNKSQINQVLDQAITETFDVHSASRRKMEDRLLALRRTEQPAGAANHCLPLRPLGGRVARRAASRKNKSLRRGWPSFQKHRHHFGNDVACTSNDYRIANSHIKPRDLIGVVQCGIGDHDAGDIDRGKPCDRCQGASAAHLHIDGLHGGEFFLRWKLVGNRPTWCSGDEAHAFLQVVAIQFVDHAVDVKRQRITLFADVAVVIQQSPNSLRRACLRGHWKSQLTQHMQTLRVCCRQADTFGHTQCVRVKCQRALRGNAWIELS